MLMRMVLCFIAHRGKMSCMQASGMIACKAIHRSQLTRFLERARWKSRNFNEPLRTALLKLEALQGVFILIVDATLTSQQGKLTENRSAFKTANNGALRRSVTGSVGIHGKNATASPLGY